MNLLTSLSWVWTTETQLPANTHGAVGTSSADQFHRFAATDGITDAYTQLWAGTSQH